MGLGLRGKIRRLRTEVGITYKKLFHKPNIYKLSTPERLGAIYDYPSDMCEADKIMLYALVRGLRPRHAIEIGSRWGGSAKIITNAMQDNNHGKLVGIDPEISAFRVSKKELHGRFTLHNGYSPQATPDAVKILNTDKIDFVFIDGLHTHDAVKADLEGVLPYLADGAYVLLHDGFHQGINKAIQDVVSASDDLVDMGFMTRHPQHAAPVGYQGIRMLRKGTIDAQKDIEAAYSLDNSSPPVFHYALRNYDGFANRIGLGATPEELETIKTL